MITDINTKLDELISKLEGNLTDRDKAGIHKIKSELDLLSEGHKLKNKKGKKAKSQ